MINCIDIAPRAVLYPRLWDVPENFIDTVSSMDGWFYPDGKGQIDHSGYPVASFLFLNQAEIPEDIYVSYNLAYITACTDYCKMQEMSYENSCTSSMEVKKYDLGGRYDAHVNNDEDPDHQQLSVILMFPNDNYEGGEVVLTDYGFTYKPKKGDVLIFPATYLNESLVSSGAYKYEVLAHEVLVPYLDLTPSE